MKRIYALVAIILLLASGCSTTNWRGEAVREQLSHSNTLGAHQVAIDEPTKGEITLTGSVASEHDRAEIERIARRTSGVTDVRNQLVVTPSSVVIREGNHPSGYDRDPQARFPKSDTQISREVRDVLERNRDLDLRKIDIQTSDGIVTLRGSQNHYRDVERLVALISSIDGVRAVRNELIVVGRGGDRYSQERDQQIPTYISHQPYVDRY